jgi:hypothetical protein
VLEYIEVEPSDIELANQLAHEVLGRTLDELPPQTRKLLSLVYDWVTQQCEAEKINQRDFRFSRREVRDATGWGNTQLKIHFKRLEDMEYVLLHRGGRGQSFIYELVYHGQGELGECFFNGLLSEENLTNKGKWSGSNGKLSGSSRPQVGTVSGGSRSAKTPLQASDTVDIEELIEKVTEKDLLEKNKKVPSGDSLPLMVMS